MAGAVQPDLAASLACLRAPATIRERAELVFAAAEAGRLAHFALDLGRLDACAQYVAETIRGRYPDLAVPYHSRWRHFAAGGVERWPALAGRLAGQPAREVARSRIDLATVSVLLDAGAGETWRYRETATGAELGRSEGLAVASLALFAAGAFSARPEAPLRADAAALAAIDAATLAKGFQVSERNPLVGLKGRVELLRRLGTALDARPDLFGAKEPRLGNLLDHWLARHEAGPVPAAAMLETLLDGLATIWPGRICLGGHNLGDVWPHPAARRDDGDPADGLVPFHKLSQWLCFSLVEPLEDAGIAVSGLDALTGLPEYRNGGLFIDLGVLVPRDAAALRRTHAAGAELVVEWRALTVALLDRLAAPVRARLGLDAERFPVPKLLEGGTWAAGRRIAAERRPGGVPPIRLESDGTVF
jgi:hypothetical protein